MDNNDSFLQFLQQNPQSIFIEVEAREDKMPNFISGYNGKYHKSISMLDQGIRKLGDVDNFYKIIDFKNKILTLLVAYIKLICNLSIK